MCTHTRLIRNKYTGKAVRVACGKCDACRQEKAVKRANRIRNHSRSGYIGLFITLTYENRFLPVIRRDELAGNLFVPVYRHASVRHYRNNEIVTDGIRPIDEMYIGDDSVFDSDVPSPRKMSDDYIGICYYKDLQDFFKRLRINLKRKFNYDKAISYYGCSEYGSISKRPHFHVLLYCPQGDVETLRRAVVASWSFADKSRTYEYIEVSKDASSYVASYVNCGSTFPALLQKAAWRQKHSYSKDFGVSDNLFSLSSIIQKVHRCDLSYVVPTVANGVPVNASVPIPQYVINRFFPKIKGYSLLTDNEICKFLLRTSTLSKVIGSRNPLFAYSVDDEHKLFVRLLHIRDKFRDLLGWSYEYFDNHYPWLYVKAWNAYKSTLLRMSYSQISSVKDWLYFYENNNEILEQGDSSFLHYIAVNGLDVSLLELDPNKRRDIVNKSLRLEEQFFRNDKTKKVVNKAMFHLGHNV